MSLANRPNSPIFAQKKRNKEMCLDANKIHRVQLNSESICKLAQIGTSPNCIWFKLHNEISDKLQYAKPYNLKKLEREPKEYDYVMAPFDNNTYVRARVVVIKKSPLRDFAFVHFIDKGYGAWMDMKCLAEMESQWFYHPWQAFPIALFKHRPGIVLNTLRENADWSEEIFYELIKIMEDYEFFRVVPIQDSRRNANYSEYLRAEVFGLLYDEVESILQHNIDSVHLNRQDKNRQNSNYRQGKGESIAHRLVLEMPIYPPQKTSIFSDNEEDHIFDGFFMREWFDAKEQRLLPAAKDELTKETLKEMPSWYRSFPEDFNYKPRNVSQNGDINFFIKEDAGTENEWDPVHANDSNACHVPTVNMDFLNKHNRDNKNKCFWICAEWKSLKSPSEFYAFPLKVDGNRPDDMIRELYKDQIQWNFQLDSFYGNPNNRKPVDSLQVACALARGPVFAIYEVNDEFVTSTYRRVQLLAIRDASARDVNNEFCRVRFLDIGGTTIVPLAGLLKIHSSHCKEMPKCIQLFASEIMPPNNASDWSDEEQKYFRKLARSDVPLRCHLEPYTSPRQKYGEMPKYNDLPQHWPGVMAVSRICMTDSNTTIEEEMHRANKAVMIMAKS